MPRDPKRGTVLDSVLRDPGRIMPPPTTQAFRDNAERMGFRALRGNWCEYCDKLRCWCSCAGADGPVVDNAGTAITP